MFKVKFTPTSVGNKSATLTVKNNSLDADSTFIINLNGSGKLPQTITFSLGSDSTKTIGDPDFNLTATGGNSGNPVTFSSSNANVATISGNTVTIVGDGSTTITASQTGNDNYLAAIDVTQTLTVNKSQVTSLPQNFQNAKLTLFPNPVITNLQMEIKGKTSSTEVKIVVLNNQGKEVLTTSQTLKNGKLTLPVQGLSTGQYLIKINIGDETVLRRIIKL